MKADLLLRKQLACHVYVCLHYEHVNKSKEQMIKDKVTKHLTLTFRVISLCCGKEKLHRSQRLEIV